MARNEDLIDNFDDEEFRRQLENPEVDKVQPPWAAIPIAKDLYLRLENYMGGLRRLVRDEFNKKDK